MNNFLVLPLVIPLCTAFALLFFRRRLAAQRLISIAGLLTNAAIAWIIAVQVREKGIQTLHMGGWLPPYGIVFVADMLAALLVAAASVIALSCVVYAIGSIGEERERHYFYPFVFFLVAGVNGSFLTGDLFNLFVCFEVTLIASYALIVLGGTRLQLRETLKYMFVNIVSSTLFVAGVAYLYGVTGTLNMADLSLKIAEAGASPVLHTIALLFLLVFSIKAGLFLFMWLPGAYGAPPAAVSALFAALLTKVGVYALIRTFTLLFYTDEAIIHGWLQGMAIVTMLLGALGAVAYSDVRRIMNYNVVIGIGFLAFGIAVSTEESLKGAVFYLVHDMPAKALLFIIGGLVIRAAGTSDIKMMGGLIKRYPLLGGLLFVCAAAIAGMPPLSGFPGKLLLIQGGLAAGYGVLSAVALLSSLLSLYSLLRIFMHAFWGEEKRPNTALRLGKLPFLPVIWLSVLIVWVGAGAEVIYGWVSSAGDVMLQPSLYIDSVLRR